MTHCNVLPVYDIQQAAANQLAIAAIEEWTCVQNPLLSVKEAVAQLDKAGETHAIKECRLAADIASGPWQHMSLLTISKQASIFYDLQCEAITQGRLTAWTSEWDARWAALHRAAQQDIRAAFLRPNSPQPIDTTLSIWRFEGVQQALCASSAAVLNEQALGELRRRLPDIISSLNRHGWSSRQEDGRPLCQDDLIRLAKIISGSFQQVLSEEALLLIHKHMKTPAQMKLEECSAAASQRSQLEERIAKLMAAKAVIDKLKL